MSSDLQSIVASILSPATNGDLLSLQNPELDNVTWQDFTKIHYLFEPPYIVAIEPPPPPVSLEAVAVAIDMEEKGIPESATYLSFKRDLSDAAQRGIIRAFERYGQRTESSVNLDEASGMLELRPWDGVGSNSYDIPARLDLLMSALSNAVLADLMEFYLFLLDRQQGTMVRPPHPFFKEITKHFARPREDWVKAFEFYRDLEAPVAVDLAQEWETVRHGMREFTEFEEPSSKPPPIAVDPEPAPSGGCGGRGVHGFQVIADGTYNLGLQLIYRQEWRALGNQRGEIVRTIPLGPKQTEKVSTKTVRRMRRSTSSESVHSVESTNEVTDTTSDSTEVLREAQESNGWDVSAEASFGLGGAGASLSGGQHAEATEMSRDTATRLSEVAQKTASKIRTETKVTVDTEVESSFEATTSSVIQNPNEEIAITYVYSKLQRQYEVFTGLSAVRPVVMVAEYVPGPDEIDLCWVRRYDWILARALLDSSFEGVMSSIRTEAPAPLSPDHVASLEGVRDRTVEHLGTLAVGDSRLSVSDVDFVAESQEGVLKAVEAYQARSHANTMLQQQRERLYQHIRDNILHYCRAVWAAEDTQQRLLRVRGLGIEVPLEWEFSTPGIDLDEALDVGATGVELDGEFVGSGRAVNIADLISPTGPVAYQDNYAVYHLAPEQVSDELRTVFAIAELPYVDPDAPGYGSSTVGVTLDPVLRRKKEEHPPASVTEDQLSLDARVLMVSYVPELRLQQAAGLLDMDDLDLFRGYYPHYLYRREMSRRFPLDINSLMVDIVRGHGSALEPFKLAHRSVDVEKSLAERDRLLLENRRRRKLLANERYGDPDIEEVSVIVDRDSADLPIDLGE